MFTIISTVQQAQANGVALAKMSFKDFTKTCIADGYTAFREWLNPAAGKTPCMFFKQPGTENVRIIVLSKAVSAQRASGNLSDALLRTLSVVKGKNAKGEDRQYLSSNGITEITSHEVLQQCEAIEQQVAKLNAERLQKLIS